MSIFNKIFKSSNSPKKDVKTIKDFWEWFVQEEARFYKAIQQGDRIEEDFFIFLSEKLAKLNERIFFLVGMEKKTKIAELILTPDAVVKNIAFIEDLIAAAPTLPNWKFIALKQASDIDSFAIRMGDLEYNKENINFYPIEHSAYPDQIDLVMVHDHYDENRHHEIYNGVCIYLDNVLGEYKSITMIDNLSVCGPATDLPELISIDKLEAYLTWREKEFVERYHDVRHNSAEDSFASFEGSVDDGTPLFAIVNNSILHWDYKASHPWILLVMVHYQARPEDGFPNQEEYERLEQLENDLMEKLPEEDGYILVVRETGNGLREVSFACHEFRKPSRVMDAITRKYAQQFQIEYDIYKDKYWRTFEKFAE